MAQQIKKKYLSSEVISYFDDQISQVATDVANEESRAISAENQISSDLSQEVLDRQSAVSSEESSRIAADGVLQGNIDTLSGTVSSNYSELDGKITTEKNRAEGAESALSGRLDSLEADPVTKTYVDGKVDFLISNVSPEAIDSFSEVVTAFQAADANLNQAITNLSNAATSGLDAETQARIAADQALDARIDVLESVVWFKEKFSISNGQTSVTLSHTPEASSMSAFVDRLAIHEGASEDYTISGTTVTFLNDLVSPGNSQLGNGDTVYVKYQYKV